MTKLIDLINQPNENMSQLDINRNLQSIYQFLNGLLTISNSAQTLNSDFSTLSGAGTTPVTQADGDNFEFIQNWFVVGSTVATYSLQATQYVENSDVISKSDYYMHVQVSAYTGTGMYFYQRQLDTVRKYQKQFITLSISATNNTDSTVIMNLQIISHLETGNDIVQQGGSIYFQSGDNMNLSTTLQMPTLDGQSVDSTNYTEFRLVFSGFSAAQDFDLYYIKAEIGTIATPLF